MNGEPTVLKVSEVADELRCSRETVYRMIRSERLRAVRFHTKLRVPRVELDRYLAGNVDIEAAS